MRSEDSTRTRSAVFDSLYNSGNYHHHGSTMTKSTSPRSRERERKKRALSAASSTHNKSSSNSTFGSSNSSLLSMLPFEIQECSDEDDSEASFEEDDISSSAAFWQESSSSLHFNMDHTPCVVARRGSSDSDQFDKCLKAMEAHDYGEESDDESEVEWDGVVPYNHDYGEDSDHHDDDHETFEDSNSIDLAQIVQEMQQHSLSRPQRTASPLPRDHPRDENGCTINPPLKRHSSLDITEDTLSVSETTDLEEQHEYSSKTTTLASSHHGIKRYASLEDMLLDKGTRETSNSAVTVHKVDAAPCKARRRMSNPSLISMWKQQHQYQDDHLSEVEHESAPLRLQTYPSIPPKQTTKNEDSSTTTSEDLAPSMAHRKPSLASLVRHQMRGRGGGLHQHDDSNSAIRSYHQQQQQNNASWSSSMTSGQGTHRENPLLANLE